MTEDKSHGPEDFFDQLKQVLGPDVQFIPIDPEAMAAVIISKSIADCLCSMIDAAESGAKAVHGIMRANEMLGEGVMNEKLGLNLAGLRDQVVIAMITVEQILAQVETPDDLDPEWQAKHDEAVEHMHDARKKFLAETAELS